MYTFKCYYLFFSGTTHKVEEGLGVKVQHHSDFYIYIFVVMFFQRPFVDIYWSNLDLWYSFISELNGPVSGFYSFNLFFSFFFMFHDKLLFNIFALYTMKLDYIMQKFYIMIL